MAVLADGEGIRGGWSQFLQQQTTATTTTTDILKMSMNHVQ